MTRIALFGVATPFAADVETVAIRSGYEIVAAIHNVNGEPGVKFTPVYSIDQIPNLDDVPCYFPMVTPRHRRTAISHARDLGLTIGTVLADRSVSMAGIELVGEATFINAGAVIGAASTIADCVVVNRSASIGHHGKLGAYCSIGPGAVLGGGVTVGAEAFVGVGATVLPKVTIGEGAFIGGGAVVTKDVEPGVTVIGNPARPVVRDLNTGT